MQTLCGAAPSLAPRISSQGRDGQCQLGLRLAFEILDALDDPFARAFFGDHRLRDLLNLRNETIAGHGTENIRPKQAEEAAQRLIALLQPHFAALPAELRQARGRPRQLRS